MRSEGDDSLAWAIFTRLHRRASLRRLLLVHLWGAPVAAVVCWVVGLNWVSATAWLVFMIMGSPGFLQVSNVLARIRANGIASHLLVLPIQNSDVVAALRRLSILNCAVYLYHLGWVSVVGTLTAVRVAQPGHFVLLAILQLALLLAVGLSAVYALPWAAALKWQNWRSTVVQAAAAAVCPLLAMIPQLYPSFKWMTFVASILLMICGMLMEFASRAADSTQESYVDDLCEKMTG